MNNNTWRRTTLTTYECNFDASFLHTTHQSKAGWITGENNEISLYWGSAKMGITESLLEAEAKALLIAMQQSWSIWVSTLYVSKETIKYSLTLFMEK